MPTQKRPYEIHYQQPDTESDPSPSSSDHDHDDAEEKEKEKPEYVVVRLSEVRKEVQCPICLGVIRKTRTVMECLHRFCRECIDKSMRIGNNECPACRTHCASRRSLRDDPNFDALIAVLYPNIDKYEEEEVALCEEEKARNKQIQDTIAQTFRRQAEALSRKKTTAKITVAAFARRMEDRYRDVNSRGRQNYRITESEGSDDSDDANGDVGNDSSSAGEHSEEVKPKRHKRLMGARLTSDRGGDKKEIEVNRESLAASTGLIGPSERLWGKGGLRSHTRHGSGSAGNGKNSQNSCISKLVQHLQNLEEKDYEMDVHFMLVSLDEQRAPKLQRPYICCSPTSSVKGLRQQRAGKRKRTEESPVEVTAPHPPPSAAPTGMDDLPPISIGFDDIRVSYLLADTTIGAPREATPSSFSPAVGASSSSLPPPQPIPPIEVAAAEHPPCPPVAAAEHPPCPPWPTTSSPIQLHFVPGPVLPCLPLPNSLLQCSRLDLNARLSSSGPDGPITVHCPESVLRPEDLPDHAAGVVVPEVRVVTVKEVPVAAIVVPTPTVPPLAAASPLPFTMGMRTPNPVPVLTEIDSCLSEGHLIDEEPVGGEAFPSSQSFPSILSKSSDLQVSDLFASTVEEDIPRGAPAEAIEMPSPALVPIDGPAIEEPIVMPTEVSIGDTVPLAATAGLPEVGIGHMHFVPGPVLDEASLESGDFLDSDAALDACLSVVGPNGPATHVLNLKDLASRGLPALGWSKPSAVALPFGAFLSEMIEIPEEMESFGGLTVSRQFAEAQSSIFSAGCQLRYLQEYTRRNTEGLSAELEKSNKDREEALVAATAATVKSRRLEEENASLRCELATAKEEGASLGRDLAVAKEKEVADAAKIESLTGEGKRLMMALESEEGWTAQLQDDLSAFRTELEKVPHQMMWYQSKVVDAMLRGCRACYGNSFKSMDVLPFCEKLIADIDFIDFRDAPPANREEAKGSNDPLFYGESSVGPSTPSVPPSSSTGQPPA